MLKRLWTRLQGNPQLSWSDLFFTVLPALAWLAAVQSRPIVIRLVCSTHPQECTPGSVNFLDRSSLGLENPQAETLSYYTQHWTGYLALGLPLLWLLYLAITRRWSVGRVLRAWGTDWVLLLQTIVWNGLATETARLLIQRPRPFVYKDPVGLGGSAAHYVSFYSGHTSFVAAAGAAAFFTLLARKAPRALLWPAGLAFSLLTMVTGVCRVLAGRHFITDCLFAAAAGILTAALIAYTHRAPRA